MMFKVNLGNVVRDSVEKGVKRLLHKSKHAYMMKSKTGETNADDDEKRAKGSAMHRTL